MLSARIGAKYSCIYANVFTQGDKLIEINK